MNNHARAWSALQAIPCPGDYETWNRIGIEAIAAGLTLEDVDTWSSTGPNYKGTRDVKANFKAVTPDGGIGPGSLFRRARENGWQDSEKSSRQHGHRTQQRARAANPNHSGKRAPRADKSVLDLWNRLDEASEGQEYIRAKRGRPDGLRVVPEGESLTIQGQFVTGWLAVPAWSLSGELRTIQFIPPPGQGKKLNLPDASFEDGMFVVGDLAETDRIYIVEGIGQAWACWAATGKAAVVCFGAGRMKTVAEILWRAHPNKRLIVVPDRGKERQAAEIARIVSGEWVEMPDDKPGNYDANDYAAEHGADELAELLEKTKHPPQRFRLLTAPELATLPPYRWRIRGVLPQAGIGAVFGPSGSGKSFLVMDMLAAVATGQNWFDCRVKQAPVLYIALEGEAGISQRIQAYQIRHGELPSSFCFLISPLDMRKADDRAELVKSARAAGLVEGVLVLDTLNRAAPGMDENDSQDMGEVITAAKALQAELGGLVLLVHHTGKDGTKGLRGHSSLHAALDCAVEVRRDGDRREWLIAKAKDGNDGEAHPFRLDVVEVGEDEDGEPVTSCIVMADEAAQVATRPKLPKGGNQRIVWDALGDLLKTSKYIGMAGAPPARPCVELEAAIEAIAPRLPCEERRKKTRTREAFTSLLANKSIEHREGWVWLP